MADDSRLLHHNLHEPQELISIEALARALTELQQPLPTSVPLPVAVDDRRLKLLDAVPVWRWGDQRLIQAIHAFDDGPLPEADAAIIGAGVLGLFDEAQHDLYVDPYVTEPSQMWSWSVALWAFTPNKVAGGFNHLISFAVAEATRRHCTRIYVDATGVGAAVAELLTRDAMGHKRWEVEPFNISRVLAAYRRDDRQD